jgi:hypothetical protein
VLVLVLVLVFVIIVHPFLPFGSRRRRPLFGAKFQTRRRFLVWSIYAGSVDAPDKGVIPLAVGLRLGCFRVLKTPAEGGTIPP